ncbi:hypothetical protein E2C01_039598 [Portunus trituberculatus]|uniref:Uncharacterized protein n=1 Tax=Portunus trituberculatus TaxID=210409 RepID=A0A5B7FH91_PORTR|nr:hypothetical protein [Portunus trituberculatus]
MARQTATSSFFRPVAPSAESAVPTASPLLPTPSTSGLPPAGQDVSSTSSDDEMAFTLNIPPHVPSSSDDEKWNVTQS